MFYDIYNSKFGDIILVGDENGLSNLHIEKPDGKRKFDIEKDWIKNPLFFIAIKDQLDDFFSQKNTSFDIKLNLIGTDFQKSVWLELTKIPFGETRSYQDIAIAIGKPKASRAIGMANSKNPIPIIIPCHRVIGKNGKLTGFAHGLELKQELLNFENKKES